MTDYCFSDESKMGSWEHEVMRDTTMGRRGSPEYKTNLHKWRMEQDSSGEFVYQRDGESTTSYYNRLEKFCKDHPESHCVVVHSPGK